MARKGQQKQAKDVNRTRHGKGREGKGREVTGRRTICTLQMLTGQNDFTPNNLPVMIRGHNYCKKSSIIRYRQN